MRRFGRLAGIFADTPAAVLYRKVGCGLLEELQALHVYVGLAPPHRTHLIRAACAAQSGASRSMCSTIGATGRGPSGWLNMPTT